MKLSNTNPMTLKALALCATAGLASGQSTWYVDDDHPNDPTPGVSGLGFPFSNPSEDGGSNSPFDDLQKAIDAAVDGDTVLVRPSNWFGYYTLTTTFGTLDFRGKELTVKSTGGADVTAIDGRLLANSTGVLIDGSGPATVFEGFTIQNCDRGSTSGDHGGGLLVENSNPAIRNCRFVGNNAYRGGGLFLDNSAASVEDCLFLGNTVVFQGAGLHSNSGSLDIVRCTFDSNVAGYGGGALIRTVAEDLVEVVDCLFQGNQATLAYGGGLAKFDNGSISVQRSRFVQNVATTVGGGVQMNGPGAISECLFIANSAANGAINTDGGGSGSVGTTVVTGSTFTQNIGGAATETDGTLVLHNCIAWNDGPFEFGSGVSATHCDVLGGWPGAGNIDVDPHFRDAFGADGLLGTLDDDLRLLKTSPCIDAGDTLQLGGAAFPVDKAGNPRALDDPKTANTGVASLWLTTDIGAFEFQPPSASCARAKSVTLFQKP